MGIFLFPSVTLPHELLHYIKKQGFWFLEWLCINSYINSKGNDMFTTVKMFLLSNAYKLLGFSIKKIMPIIYAYSNVYT